MHIGDKMMMPENGHRAHGFSSANFLDSDEIIKELKLNGDETFMDAGCGDGHNAIKILEDYNHKGTVYAVDIYDASIEDMETYKNDNNVENLINIEADITEGIPGVEDGSIDVVLLVIAIMDYKAWDVPNGPPTKMRSSPEDLEKLFNKHNLKKVYLNEEIGEDIPQGKSHYLIMFKKN